MHNKHWQNAYSFLIHVWQPTNRHLMPSLLQRIKGALENVSNMMHAWRWHMHTAYWIICGNQRIGALCRRCYTEQTAPLNIFLTWCTLNTKSFIVLFDYVAPMINWHLVPLMIQRTKGTSDNTFQHNARWPLTKWILLFDLYVTINEWASCAVIVTENKRCLWKYF